MRAPHLSRRQWLWILGLIALALQIVLSVLEMRMRDLGDTGIVGFEFAGTEERAGEIIADWGDEGQDAARLSLWLDYPYLIAYGAFGALAIAAIRDAARVRGWDRLARFGGPIVAAPLIAAGFDAIEDVGLLLALGGHGGDAAPRLAMTCAIAKFTFIAVALAYALAALVTRLTTAEAR